MVQRSEPQDESYEKEQRDLQEASTALAQLSLEDKDDILISCRTSAANEHKLW
jgi:hypothetical protein